MIAFGDAFYRKSFAHKILAVGFGLGSYSNSTSDSGEDPMVYDTRFARERHRGKLNLTFCDGHVEGIKVNELYFNNGDTWRQKWFKDHRPHTELAQKN